MLTRFRAYWRDLGVLALIWAALFTIFSLLPAGAADLNGGCCADLEERVAELEATTAKKGNRKMSVVVYGEVDRAFLYTHNLGSKQYGFIDNSNSPSRFGVMGEGKINKDWKAGYRIELGLSDRPPIGILNEQVTIRHLDVWVESATLGRVTVGHTDMASQGTGQITVANTTVASRMLSLAPLSTAFLLGYDLPFNDVRRDGIRYDSPSLGGFIVSGGYADGDQGLVAVGFNPSHAVDIAVRYANEFKGGGDWRLAAGVSYRDENQSLGSLPFIPLTRETVVQASASLKQMSSGLFVNLAMGRVTNDVIFGDFSAYQVQAGWEKNVFGIGATTLFGGWGEMVINGGPKPWQIELGAVQAVDAAALDLYVSWKQIDLDTAGTKKVDQVMGGFRVKF